jgi:energy-coupling factor transporter ATP-binding protein EcfA2
MPLRDRPLLVGGIDRDLYVPRPELEHALGQSVDAGRNVLLIGPPGSGKSTTMRKLAADLSERKRRGILVLASPASSSEDLLALVRSELLPLSGGMPGEVTRTELLRNVSRDVPVISLIDAARQLGQADGTVIMLDGPVRSEIVYELFGRLREELWALPHQWVLALRTNQSAAARKPPADAFFPQLIEIPPLQPAEIRNLLERALSEDDLRTVRAELANHGELPLRDYPSEMRYPRDVVNLAHRALAGTLHSGDVELRRATLAADLGRSASMALAEIEALARPVSAGDDEFLGRMGWTEAHARRLLAQMERGGVLSSISDATLGSPGRPRKLYVPNHHV